MRKPIDGRDYSRGKSHGPVRSDNYSMNKINDLLTTTIAKM